MKAFKIVLLNELDSFFGRHCILDWNISKGNQAPTQTFERPNQKIPKSYFFLPRSRIGASSSLESSIKRFLGRFESKQMISNDFFIV